MSFHKVVEAVSDVLFEAALAVSGDSPQEVAQRLTQRTGMEFIAPLAERNTQRHNVASSADSEALRHGDGSYVPTEKPSQTRSYDRSQVVDLNATWRDYVQEVKNVNDGS